MAKKTVQKNNRLKIPSGISQYAHKKNMSLYQRYISRRAHRYISNKIISAQGNCQSWYNVQIDNLTVL